MVSRSQFEASIFVDEKGIRYLKRVIGLNRNTVNKALSLALKQATPELLAHIRGRIKYKHPETSTKQMATSLEARVDRRNTLPNVKFGVFRGPAIDYWRVQEYGTDGYNPDSPVPTITPKKAKLLVAPNSDDPRSVRSGHIGEQGNLFAIYFKTPVGKRGNVKGLLFRNEDSGKKLSEMVPAYFLLTHVDIPPKFYLRDGLASAIPLLLEVVGFAGFGILTKQEEARKRKLRL